MAAGQHVFAAKIGNKNLNQQITHTHTYIHTALLCGSTTVWWVGERENGLWAEYYVTESNGSKDSFVGTIGNILVWVSLCGPVYPPLSSCYLMTSSS